ncbi:MAG TPA: bifunctional polysaccharide deacetylase/glycosyltransferase family 2 protein [Actinocrinis sp.]|uniref:bifunctional polysaccharide deacetylase/glycosyltransferase family 2 protein n=1 Tax=Actinocrinis sp. TaxID=1920516 RepID=UPI002DDCFD72|nr:bifunctional polysaccharide deacetylase/glycosyltransferase family 2 protein [Actinocrinis sp.]HEV2343931.1 bifunctional polysaccharide deacetylase/glycosyltransferase family 2 protein [Actinocrinis sp.]
MAGRRRAARAVPPRAHWLLVAFSLISLFGMLLIYGLVHHEVGGEGSSGPHIPVSSDQVPAAIAQGGPVIDTRGGAQRSYPALPGHIALSFDDGPDPQWTPQVLAVLAKYHVPATFFLVGGRVAQNPQLARAEVAAGNQVGIHTFTHDDLAMASEWRRSFEFSQTQSVIDAATGVSTALLRPPYSSEPDSLDNADWAALRDAGAHGYLVVLTNRDSEDWMRPGVARIVANVLPAQGTPGLLVMMHDAGGDRSQTVAALDRLIPLLKARGYTFTTVSGLIGAPSPQTPAVSSQQWRGRVLILAVQSSDFTVTALGWIILVAGVLSILRLLLLLGTARRHARRRRGPWGPPVWEPVSVIVPAYNEEAGIEATLISLLDNEHPMEIIVVDDGSTDGTSAIVRRFANDGVRLIRQPNAGKPAALNNGMANARGRIMVLLDGDTVFAPDAIHQLVQPFSDPGIGAVSGNAKVANRTGLLGRWQHIEYVVGFNLDRRFYDLAGCMPTVPGAIGAFRREALADVGGLSDSTLAEDTDLTMAIIRAGWRVVYAQDAIAWTEAPASLGQLWKQRYRWSYGTMQAMWKHRRSVFDGGGSGRLGRRGLPYLVLFQILLPLLAPLVDVFAVYGLIFGDVVKMTEVWLGFLAVQTAAGWYAFTLDRERHRVLWSLPLQQFVYRQLMYLVLIQSAVTAVIGTRLRWQRMDRQGVARALGGDRVGGLE